jgi:hypothetical protein
VRAYMWKGVCARTCACCMCLDEGGCGGRSREQLPAVSSVFSCEAYHMAPRDLTPRTLPRTAAPHITRQAYPFDKQSLLLQMEVPQVRIGELSFSQRRPPLLGEAAARSVRVCGEGAAARGFSATRASVPCLISAWRSRPGTLGCGTPSCPPATATIASAAAHLAAPPALPASPRACQARMGWSGALVNLIPSITGDAMFTARTGAGAGLRESSPGDPPLD